MASTKNLKSKNMDNAPLTAHNKGPSFSQIKPKRAFEEVCEQIRREIALGTLKPGDRLPPEREFAEQLGVSRTAIREALRSLENAGLVQCHQGMGGGAFICERDSNVVTQAVNDMVTLGQVHWSDVTDTRIALTEQAIRLACDRATEEDFNAIERDIDYIEQLTAEGNFTRRSSYINEFYRLLALATHNVVMLMLLESLSELSRVLLAKVDPAPKSDVIEVRRKVLQFMRSNNPSGAIKELSTHLRNLDKYLHQQSKKSTGNRSASGQIK